MTKHTPGPWAVHPSAPMSIHQPEYQCWIPQNKSDAQLIAAAPDLLDVTQGFRRKLATYVSVYPGDKELRRLLGECDAAIAKATGETT